MAGEMGYAGARRVTPSRAPSIDIPARYHDARTSTLRMCEANRHHHLKEVLLSILCEDIGKGTQIRLRGASLGSCCSSKSGMDGAGARGRDQDLRGLCRQ